MAKVSQGGNSLRAIVDFHAHNKLLIMSHSLKHLQEMGRLVANTKDSVPQRLINRYQELLMEALKLKATAKKKQQCSHAYDRILQE
jgi:uncharacterized protein YbgA (DUF1722 family)